MTDEIIEEEIVTPTYNLDTPEGRRDYAVDMIVAVGGVVLDVIPQATEEDPHTVAGYRLILNYPTPEAKELCESIQLETEVSGLVPWTEAPQPVIEPEEWPYGYDEEGNPNPDPNVPVLVTKYYDENGLEVYYDSETETWRYVETDEPYIPSEI